MTTAKDYLSAMGIQIWKARGNFPGAKPDIQFQSYSLLKQNDQKHIGYLLVDASYNNEEEKISQLMDMMLKAIDLKRDVLVSFDTIKNSDKKNILIMGLELAKKLHLNFNQDYRVVAIYHPDDLLRQPNYKRQAWMDLQHFAKALK